MAHKLYEHFLEDPAEYALCESFWRDMVSRTAGSLGQSGEWRPWIPHHFADGSPMEADGNPIFDARNDNLGRAIRIIQQRHVSSDVEFAGWLKEYDPEYTDDLPRSELVLNLGLSEESARLAEAVMRFWMLPQTSVAEMSAFVEQVTRDHSIEGDDPV